MPAVTGACLMVERALYERSGGLPDDYVQGGYEDSDLCLRLIEAGRRNWYMADVELYHLEAQSYRIDVRLGRSLQRVAADASLERRIEEMMRAQPEAADAHVVASARAARG